MVSVCLLVSAGLVLVGSGFKGDGNHSCLMSPDEPHQRWYPMPPRQTSAVNNGAGGSGGLLVWAEISLVPVFRFRGGTLLRGGTFQEVVAYTSLLHSCWTGVATGNSEGMLPPPSHEESLAVKEMLQRRQVFGRALVGVGIIVRPRAQATPQVSLVSLPLRD